MGPGGPGSDPLPPAPGVAPPHMGDVAGAVARATESPVPTMKPGRETSYTLPCGMVTGDPQNPLVASVRVRELTGFDEEKLARLTMTDNVANYQTELLACGVEVIGATPPSRDALRGLLIGDRDALVLAVRRATFGDLLDFKLDCDACGEKSDIVIDLATDVEVVTLENPLVRTFDVETSRGTVKVRLLNGFDQEAFSESAGKKVKTRAEVSTLMLAKSVQEINGVPTYGDENAVRALPSGDRVKILDFVADIQPGPQLQQPVPVNCATCGKEFPISLGLENMFRF
jgi:hypothetical protein